MLFEICVCELEAFFLKFPSKTVSLTEFLDFGYRSVKLLQTPLFSGKSWVPFPQKERRTAQKREAGVGASTDGKARTNTHTPRFECVCVCENNWILFCESEKKWIQLPPPPTQNESNPGSNWVLPPEAGEWIQSPPKRINRHTANIVSF